MTQQPESDLALDPDLMAYLDGSLPADQMVAVEARLARDPDAREAVAQWRHLDNMLHVYASSADQQPANLRIAALERELAGKLRKRQWRARLLGPGLQRIAASIVLFAAGWVTHGVVNSGSQSLNASLPYFVAPTLTGHSSYGYAATELAQFGSDEMTDAVEWLSAQMKQKIDSPKLERLGYEVESARLTMIDDQPVAVFYYRNPSDELVTVSMAPRPVSQPGYGLRVATVNGNRMAYWSSGNLHYTVVAGSTSASITSLAAAVQE